MYEELTRLLYKYYKDKKYADEAFILEASNIIKHGLNIIDSVNEIKMKKKKNCGAFNSTLKCININPDLKIHANGLDYVVDKYEVDPILYTNIMVIHTIFHEFDHANLYESMLFGHNDIMTSLSKIWGFYVPNDSKITSYEDLKKECRELVDIYKIHKQYEKHHDYVPYETHAIIQSYRDLLNLINELYNLSINYKCLEGINKSVSHDYDYEVLRRYKTQKNGICNSPSYDICDYVNFRRNLYPEELLLYKEDKEKSFLEDSSNYSFDERIINGLHISQEEYNQYLDNSSLTEEEKEDLIFDKLFSLTVKTRKRTINVDINRAY